MRGIGTFHSSYAYTCAALFPALNSCRVGTSTTVEIPRAPQWIVFTIEIDTTQFPVYSATLVDASGKLIWRSDRTRPMSSDAIGVSIPSSLLEPGEFTLNLVRPDPRGSSDVRLAVFPLHVEYRLHAP